MITKVIQIRYFKDTFQITQITDIIPSLLVSNFAISKNSPSQQSVHSEQGSFIAVIHFRLAKDLLPYP